MKTCASIMSRILDGGLQRVSRLASSRQQRVDFGFGNFPRIDAADATAAAEAARSR